MIIAHRGACAVAPENTRSAIELAIGMGAKVIEFDVRETQDGELVLFHDDTLERVLGRKGSIEKLNWEEVSQLDVGSWFPKGGFAGENPILLEEAIKLCLEFEVVPLIEQKSGPASAYAAVIQRLEVTEKVIVQSFDWSFLKDLSEKMPELSLGALGKRGLDRGKLTKLKGLRPQWVGWKHSDLSSKGLEMLQENRFRVALWTVNDPKSARTWIERGVDAIITDRPDEMMKLIPSQ